MASEKREVYRGKAVIMNVDLIGVDDWKDWEKRDLDEADRSNAFKISYDVAEGDANGTRHTIDVEVSHRELKGRMLDFYPAHEDGTAPTQMDVAIRSLVQQGILAKGATPADIGLAIDDALCGREVYIRAYEELGKDGTSWWPRCTFAARFQKITGADKAARVAAFLSGKPAPKPTANAATASDAAPAIPAAPTDDPENLPF